jgi:hypothetical protein
MGIDWWEGDPFLAGRSQRRGLESRLKRLERASGLTDDDDGGDE